MPAGISIDRQGNLYVDGGYKVRKIGASTVS